ncbi:hypothetical protein R3P38DRAFT_2812043 [Favolaschia claudopus]|uniref:Uncharacterized protein n=1 Tax=Favolaschia claudopus TaxID=2862362 RepID=A0AAV9Z801_9AGAR
MKFKVFWWKSYVSEVKRDFEEVTGNEALSEITAEQSAEVADGDADNRESDDVVLKKTESGYVGTTNVDDYKYRPRECGALSLYEYFQMSTKLKRTKAELQQFLESVSSSSGLPSTSSSSTQSITQWLSEDSLGPEENLLALPFERQHPLWKKEGTFTGEAGEDEEFFDKDAESVLVKGPNQLSKELKMLSAEKVLRSCGWTRELAAGAPVISEKIVPTVRLRGSQWKIAITSMKEDLLAAKRKNAPASRKKHQEGADSYRFRVR